MRGYIVVDPHNIFPTMAPPPADNAAPPPTMLTGQHAKPETTADRFFPTMKADEPQGEEAKPPAQPAQPKAQPAEGEQPKPDGDDNDDESGIPSEIRELRENDRGRRMFSPQKTYEYDVPNDLLNLEEVGDDDTPAEMKAAAVAELREMAADMSMSGADVRMLIGRARAAAANPAQNEAAERSQASQQLAADLGSAQAAQQALADAKQLLDRDPRMRQLVLSLGMGNDVQTIKTLADLARRERARGRLR